MRVLKVFQSVEDPKRMSFEIGMLVAENSSRYLTRFNVMADSCLWFLDTSSSSLPFCRFTLFLRCPSRPAGWVFACLTGESRLLSEPIWSTVMHLCMSDRYRMLLANNAILARVLLIQTHNQLLLLLRYCTAIPTEHLLFELYYRIRWCNSNSVSLRTLGDEQTKDFFILIWRMKRREVAKKSTGIMQRESRRQTEIVFAHVFQPRANT